MCIYSTTKGFTCGLDLRSMKNAWQYYCPPYHGIPAALCVDKKRNWLVTGSSRGVFNVWDIRFNICVNSWSHPSKAAVSKIIPYSSSKHVLSANKGPLAEVSCWDLENATCKEAWCLYEAAEASVSTDPFDKVPDVYKQGLKVERR